MSIARTLATTIYEGIWLEMDRDFDPGLTANRGDELRMKSSEALAQDSRDRIEEAARELRLNFSGVELELFITGRSETEVLGGLGRSRPGLRR